MSSTIAFRAAWVLSKNRQPDDTHVFNAPFIVLDLKDGDSRMVEDSQGNMKEGVGGVGQSFRSRGELRMKGSKFPLTLSARYEFKDDDHHHFLVDRSFDAISPFGECALSDKNQNAVLILTWETKDKKEERPSVEKPAQDARYLIDAVIISLGSSPVKDAYQITLPTAAVGQIKDWFHCGPIRAEKSKGHANSYGGPRRDDQGERFNPDDLEYEGKLKYDVLSDGFPIRIRSQFKLEDLKKKTELFQIVGEAEFARSGDVAVIRSKAGDHLLLLRLTPVPSKLGD